MNVGNTEVKIYVNRKAYAPLELIDRLRRQAQ